MTGKFQFVKQFTFHITPYHSPSATLLLFSALNKHKATALRIAQRAVLCRTIGYPIIIFKYRIKSVHQVLDIIQVDRAFRGQGIGRQLWNLAVAEAKNAGARELYISACCSEETVGFYNAMGAKVTDDPIPEIAEAEPCDIQMTFDLT